MVKWAKHVEEKMCQISEELLHTESKYAMIFIRDLKTYVNTIQLLELYNNAENFRNMDNQINFIVGQSDTFTESDWTYDLAFEYGSC